MELWLVWWPDLTYVKPPDDSAEILVGKIELPYLPPVDMRLSFKAKMVKPKTSSIADFVVTGHELRIESLTTRLEVELERHEGGKHAAAELQDAADILTQDYGWQWRPATD